jgi:hypothetical protein
LECKNILPYTVTKDFGRAGHLYFNKRSRRGARLVRMMKRKAHRAERRTTRMELRAGQEPQLRHQITGWELI